MFRWQHPCWIYLAQDFQSKEQTQWTVNSNTELGFRIGFREVIRSLRIHAGYFSGHSDFGQFFSRKESFASLGASFDFLRPSRSELSKGNVVVRVEVGLGKFVGIDYPL